MTSHSESSDADDTPDLLRRWHAGDAVALHALVSRDLEWIRGRVRQRLGDALREHGDTEDFLQEAVLDILRYTPRFLATNGDMFRRIVSRIVENTLRGQSEHYGRLKRQRAQSAPLPSDSVLVLDLRLRTKSSPSDRAARSEEEAWLRLALDLVDPADRDLIVLREWEGLSFAAIGERLDVPENAVRMRFNRALARLADQVEALRRGSL
jgi:RNA polymerase sigma-70 factor (ECF subfamily)